jgi:hypothetical protein
MIDSLPIEGAGKAVRTAGSLMGLREECLAAGGFSNTADRGGFLIRTVGEGGASVASTQISHCVLREYRDPFSRRDVLLLCLFFSW